MGEGVTSDHSDTTGYFQGAFGIIPVVFVETKTGYFLGNWRHCKPCFSARIQDIFKVTLGHCQPCLLRQTGYL